MIKGFALIPRKPDLSRQQFHRHWREVHAPLARRIKTLRRYVQSHRLPDAIPGVREAPYEGIAEIWFDDLETGLGLGSDPDYLEGAYRDEPNFIAKEGPTFLMTRENIVVPGPALAADAPGVKAVFLLKRKPGMSVTAFQDYWRNKHAPLVPRTPGLRHYVQCHVAPELYQSDPAPAFDGVAELSWSDLESFRSAWASDAFRVEQLPDAANFLDFETTVTLLVEEVRVIWP